MKIKRRRKLDNGPQVAASLRMVVWFQLANSGQFVVVLCLKGTTRARKDGVKVELVQSREVALAREILSI